MNWGVTAVVRVTPRDPFTVDEATARVAAQLRERVARTGIAGMAVETIAPGDLRVTASAATSREQIANELTGFSSFAVNDASSVLASGETLADLPPRLRQRPPGAVTGFAVARKEPPTGMPEIYESRAEAVRATGGPGGADILQLAEGHVLASSQSTLDGELLRLRDAPIAGPADVLDVAGDSERMWITLNDPARERLRVREGTSLIVLASEPSSVEGLRWSRLIVGGTTNTVALSHEGHLIVEGQLGATESYAQRAAAGFDALVEVASAERYGQITPPRGDALPPPRSLLNTFGRGNGITRVDALVRALVADDGATEIWVGQNGEGDEFVFATQDRTRSFGFQPCGYLLGAPILSFCGGGGLNGRPNGSGRCVDDAHWFGRAGTGVASIELRLRDGTAVPGTVANGIYYVRSRQESTAPVSEPPGLFAGAAIVAKDADGNELGRLVRATAGPAVTELGRSSNLTALPARGHRPMMRAR